MNIKTIGRRKTSVARILLINGNFIKVNNINLIDYFPSEFLRAIVTKFFIKFPFLYNYGIFINVKGGGLKCQAEAIHLALARALCKINIDYKSSLKKEKSLTRDSRMVERKKFGRKKARKKFQFSKR